MTIAWGSLKHYILEGLLKDPNGERYTDEQMLIFGRWALAEVSNHTAQADTYEFLGDGTRFMFPLPPNIIGSIEKCGLVALVDKSNITYLPVYKKLPEKVWPVTNLTFDRKVFWEWPSGSITLGFIPSTEMKICLYYFRIWDIPIDDNSIINIPQWMEQPVSYLAAAAALESIGTQAANVRQWNRKNDSGAPEQNPVQKQAAWFVQQAHRLLGQQSPQDRETFYLLDPRQSMRNSEY